MSALSAVLSTRVGCRKKVGEVSDSLSVNGDVSDFRTATAAAH